MQEIRLRFTADGKPLTTETARVETAVAAVGQTAERTGAQASRGLGQAERAAISAAKAVERQAIQQEKSAERARLAAEKEAAKRTAAAERVAAADERGAARALAAQEKKAARAQALAEKEAAARITAAEKAARAEERAADRARQHAEREAQRPQRRHNAAMQQVPMQMTDAVTQLAGGQNPFLIALQQGGQLKDAFGGIRPMLTALASSLKGVGGIALLTAAAFGALAAAWYQGQEEVQGYNRALATTGNYVGKTAAQLDQMAANLDGVIGTQGDAADALTQLAETGKISGDMLERAGLVAIKSQRAMGKEVKQTVSEFVALGEEPVKASLKLNETQHYLTAAIYEQIKALEDQGDKAGAAALAQRTYADASEKAADRIVERLGYVERAWRGVTDAVSEAWNAIKDIGRPLTEAEQVAKLDAKIANTRAQAASDPGTGYGAGRAAQAAAALPGLMAERDALIENQRLAHRAAEEEKRQQEIRDAAIKAVDKVGALQEEGLSKQQKLTKALAEYRRELDKIRADNPNSEKLTPEAIARGERTVRDRVMSGGSKPRQRGAIQAATDTDRAQLAAKLAAAEEEARNLAQGLDKLNEGQKMVLLLDEQIARAKDVKTAATLREQRAEAERLAAVLQHNTIEKEYLDREAKLAAGRERELDQLASSTREWQAKAATFGLAASAIDELTLAQLDNELADKRWAQALDQNNEKLAKEIDFLQKKRDLLAGKIEARQQVEGMEADAAEIKKAAEASTKQAEALFGTYRGMFQGAEDAAVKFFRGVKGGSKEMADAMIDDLIRLQVRQRMIQPLSDVLAGGSGAGSPSGWLTQLLGSLAGGSGSVSSTPAFSPFMAQMIGLPSAAGGYDIPAGVNPLTQLHEEEMVLPKAHANVIRDLARNGGAGGGNVNLHVNVQNYEGVPVQTRQTTRGGQPALDVVIGDAVAGQMRRTGSSTQRALRDGFGMTPQLVGR